MEYFFVTMKFKSIQEIIYQSNPNSLKPVIYYPKNHADTIAKSVEFKVVDIDDNCSEGTWYISSDYEL